MKERELKLALPGRFTLPALDLGGAVTAESLPERVLRATYYDTSDLRLARHGVTLRYRTGDAGGPRWTVKLPVATTGSEVVRDEISFDGPQREAPPEARSLVTAFARFEPLVAVATLRTRRRGLRLLGEDGPLAEIDDDEVSVIEGRRVVSRFRELEVEALAEDLDLEALATQLRRAGATDAEPIPKVVRALGSRATAPPDVGAAGAAAETMGEVLGIAIADALHRLVHHDPLARLGEVEGVHQVRVALRRLRSDLRTLAGAVDPAWRSQMEPRLRDVAEALAAARDLDVLEASLARDAEGSRAALGPLFTMLDERRAEARARMRATLDDPGYVELIDALVDAVAAPPVGPDAGVAAADGMPRAVLDAWRRLARRADDLGQRTPDEAFHRTRIAAKRVRYAAELAARVLPDREGDAAGKMAEMIAMLQDALGTIQDAAVGEAAIRDSMRRGRVGSAHAFEAGRLVERQRMRAEDARRSFLARWRRARRRRWRRWAT